MTIIDAKGKPCIQSDCTVSSSNTHCSAVYFPTGANGRLEGFRLINGKGIRQTCSGTWDVEIGGGLTIFASSPTITRNEILNNTVQQIASQTKAFYGGGIYFQGAGEEAKPVITLNLVDGNVVNPPAGTTTKPSLGIGAGIYAGFNSAPTIANNTITHNTAGDGNLGNQVAGGGGVQDTMLKAAEVKLLVARTVCPGKYIIIIGGKVASVSASLRSGRQAAEGFLVDELQI